MINFKKTKCVFYISLICNFGDLLPGDSTKSDSLHERSCQVEEHIPKTIHCLSQDARLRIDCV